MPFCEVNKYHNVLDANCNNGVKIFYRTYGQGPVKVLLIIGLAGTHSSWEPQIKALAGTITPNDAESPAGDRSSGEGGGMEVCAFDNRGMGLSSVPTKKSEYTTSIMAKDAIALMDHLGWDKAHVFGHSMGAMIACKLAAMVPERVLSLALLNVTGGGYECIPRVSPHSYFWACQEYVKGISASGMQSNSGFDGQMNACWTHKLSRADLESICSAGFLISEMSQKLSSLRFVHSSLIQLGEEKQIFKKRNILSARGFLVKYS